MTECRLRCGCHDSSQLATPGVFSFGGPYIGPRLRLSIVASSTEILETHSIIAGGFSWCLQAVRSRCSMAAGRVERLGLRNSIWNRSSDMFHEFTDCLYGCQQSAFDGGTGTFPLKNPVSNGTPTKELPGKSMELSELIFFDIEPQQK